MRKANLCKLVGLLCAVLAVGCNHVAVDRENIPRGFAPYTDAKQVKAVSPEGVTYRIRSEANEPYAELGFWKEALKKRMLDGGYVFLREADIQAADRPGYLLELTAPYGQQDYAYLMAVFVHKKKIMIVESAGEVSDLTKHREAIVEAIQSLQF